MPVRTIASRAFTIAILASSAGHAAAQTCPTVTKIDNGQTAANNDDFGLAVSMSFGGLNNCPLLAVGQPNEDAPVAGADAGGFTVYQKPFGVWVQMYGQSNSSGQVGEELGYSISLADPYLIAGAPAYNTNEGRARIYRRPSNGSGYTGAVNVLPSQGGAGSGFGRAVAVSAYGGGWAVVGAPTHSYLGVDSGAAFFYTRNDVDNTWNQDYQIWGADFLGHAFDHRGAAVAMAQYTEFAAIGQPDRELSGQPQDHGTVRIVHRLANGFVSGQSQEVAPPLPEAGEHFGAAVAIEYSLLVVGAPDEDMTFQEGGFVQQAIDGGAIYIFARSSPSGNWDFVTKIRSPIPTTSGHFGAQVATDGLERIIVSEPGTKRVYLFSRTGVPWTYQASIIDPDSPAAGSFGSAVAVRAGDIAVGDAFDDNNSATNAGAVYVLDLESDVDTGDLCSNPLTIPSSGDYVGCTDLASPSQGSGDITTCGNGGSGQGNDVWFSFTAACDGNAIFDTYGSQFDTVLSVHSACPTILGGDTTIVCNDDASFAPPNNRASLVTFNFTAGQTYLVRVSGYSQAAGQFTLRHLFTYPAATNDTCATATSLGSGFVSVPFNSCGSTTDFSLTSSCGGVLDYIFHDIWFRWDATQTRSINVNTCGSGFDTVLAVYPGNQQNCPASSAAQIACNDNSVYACNPGGESAQSSVTFTAMAGHSYLIRVGGYYNEGGLGQLTIQGACQADFNHDGVVNSQDFFDFLTAFFAQAPTADYNGDGTINSQDFFDFLTAFFAGC